MRLGGKGINWELCKKLKLDRTIKWYIHKPESVRENDTHEILYNFEVQTDHLISAKRPDVVIDTKSIKQK